MRFAALLAVLSLSATAAVRRVEVTERVPIANHYERLSGRVYFGLDPKAAANRIGATSSLLRSTRAARSRSAPNSLCSGP